MKISLKINWFFLGIVLFAFQLGGFIGLSNSPIVGVAITGILGVIASIISLFSKTGKAFEFNSITQATKNDMGKTLVLFSVFMIVGAAAGIELRINNSTPPKKQFPWENSIFISQEDSDLLLTPREAIDWIVVQEYLLHMNYSSEQVQYLYSLRDTMENYEGYEYFSHRNDKPYSTIINSLPLEVSQDNKSSTNYLNCYPFY